DHGGAVDGLLERAPAADLGVVGVGPDGQVADLAGGPGGPAVQGAVQDQAHADAGADGQEAEVGDPDGQAPPALALGGQVDVVLDPDAVPENLAQPGQQPLAAPAGQVGGQDDRAPGRLEHPGAAHGDVLDLVPADAGLGGQAVGDGPELADQGAGAGGAGVLVAAGGPPPGDVGQGGPEPAAADVDPDHPAGGRIELVEDGGGAGAAAGAADLADQPGLEQGGEAEGDGRLGQPGLPGHLRPGDRPGALDLLEDGAGVD